MCMCDKHENGYIDSNDKHMGCCFQVIASHNKMINKVLIGKYCASKVSIHTGELN